MKKKKLNLTQTQFTLRAKIRASSDYAILDQMAEQYGSAKRKLFVRYIIKKEKLTDLKREFIVSEEITARQFNSIANDVAALAAAQKELKKLLIEKTQKRIAALQLKIKKAKAELKGTKAKKKEPFKIHQFKRRLDNLHHQLASFRQDLLTPSVCFGTKLLFKKQFYLKENGYKNHGEWLKDWKSSRNNQFFLIGSKDETFGNQSCQLLPGRLQLRLTHRLAAQEGKRFIEIPIEFTYEKERLAQALASGQALSYRLIKKDNGFWYVHVSFSLPRVELVSRTQYGALGIDLNSACIAVTQIDPCGNYSNSWQIPTQLRGKRSEQIEAVLGEQIAVLVKTAAEKQIPIVIEDLDFENKKLQLRSRGMNRMLSQFTYSLFYTLMSSQCLKAGVELILVNPAYTSVIGKIKFSQGYGLSTHMGAAMAIARRGLGFGERLRAKIKIGLVLPVRNRNKHPWFNWRHLNPKIFPEGYRAPWKDRRCPEHTQSDRKSSSSADFDHLTRTQKGFGGEASIFH